MPVKNFYPRSPCGERRGECGPDGWCLIISIHALLAESDAYTGTAMPAPRRFLSTLSLRRATRQACRATPRPHHFYPRSPCGERRTSPGRPGGSPRYFYPRSPCGERHTVVKENTTAITISIHALLAESDQMTCWLWTPARTFLSTLSLRRATVMPLCMRQGGNDFYPRSPCGERLCMQRKHTSVHRGFLSTLSLRRATLRHRRTKLEKCSFLSTLSLRRATLRPQKQQKKA